ncbi:signal peptidase I [Chitinophaga sp. CF418]|uniref:signal peptidase I n=1 Tax=Chitinophaga sp. CF418 TaxID=1855287 RepID=UPI00091817B1|nr:signal peptidase I [Chitinophaga sp. CF418]SHN22497.1 signal peptidase I [Chitinophaga sp. CF418]
MDNTLHTKPVQEIPVVKPRNPWIALLFSLFTPGVGQLYNGQWKKGLLIFLIILAFPVVFGITRWITFFSGFIICVLGQLLIYLYNIIDAVISARRQALYSLKPYNTWFFYVGAVAVVIAVRSIFDLQSLGVINFVVPTASSEPNVKIGDRLIIDMRAYKREPANYGDLAVFKRQGIYRIYRVVGLPGDRLEITGGKIIINGVPAKTKMIAERIIENGKQVQEYEEVLPAGHRHHIYLTPAMRNVDKDNFKVTVPADAYFLVGDNRDQALDCRYEDAVAKDSLAGKVVFSYWGNTQDRINVDLR